MREGKLEAAPEQRRLKRQQVKRAIHELWSRWNEKSMIRQRIRKALILLLLTASLLPMMMVNIGYYGRGPLRKLNRPFVFFRSLLLCQQWSLFSYIVPFNYTLHFQVQLVDGGIRELHNVVKERAGKWQPVLFHNERKAQLNLYADRRALRYYTEYLIRVNGLDPSQITRRTIFLRYQNVLPRDKAALAGSHYAPEMEYVYDSY